MHGHEQIRKTTRQLFQPNVSFYLKYSNLLFNFISNQHFIQNSTYTNESLINLIRQLVLWTCFFVLCLLSPLYMLNIAYVDRYLSVTSINQPWRQLDVRSYSSQCSTLSGFGVLAKKIRLVLNMHAELKIIECVS